MSQERVRANNLRAGEFYGQIPSKKNVSSSILSEVVHRQQIDVPEHSHELAYFTLVLEGGYSEKFAGKMLFHETSSILWHRAGISHKDQIGKNGGRFFTVEIQPDGLETLSQYSKIPEDFVDQNSPLVWLAFRLYHEFKNWQLCSALVGDCITLEMLAHSARKQLRPEKRPPVWLARVVDKLNEEFEKSPTTEELAFEVNVHPVHLASVFRQFYHETIGEYLQKLRIAKASKLLLNREIPLVEIALACGFSDQSHLTRVFKRFVGITPGVFRNSLD